MKMGPLQHTALKETREVGCDQQHIPEDVRLRVQHPTLQNRNFKLKCQQQESVHLLSRPPKPRAPRTSGS